MRRKPMAWAEWIGRATKMHYSRHLWAFSNVLKHTEASCSPISTDLLCVRATKKPSSQYVVALTVYRAVYYRTKIKYKVSERRKLQAKLRKRQQKSLVPAGVRWEEARCHQQVGMQSVFTRHAVNIHLCWSVS